MPSISSLSVRCGLQSSLDSLQRGNSHGLDSLSFLSNPSTYRNQAQSANNNLDTCTETLGCETGAMWSAYELEVASLKKKKRRNQTQRSTPPQEFPPPLTTLSGEGRLRLRRKREEGRLLLIPFKPLVAESERFGGRLLLRILPQKQMDEGGEGMREEDKAEVEEIGRFVNGGGEKWRSSGRCEKMGSAAIFNCDCLWVASS